MSAPQKPSRSRHHVRLPKSWANVSDSTLAAHLPGADEKQLRLASIIVSALSGAREAKLKGLNHAHLAKALRRDRAQLRKDLNWLIETGLVAYVQKPVKTTDGRTRWYRLSDLGQRLVDRSLRYWYPLYFDQIKAIGQPTPLALWVCAICTSNPDLTSPEVAEMLNANVKSVDTIRRRVNLVTPDTKIEDILTQGIYVRVNDEPTRERIYALMREWSPHTDRRRNTTVFVNGLETGVVEATDFYFEAQDMLPGAVTWVRPQALAA
jgi:hypothetical protein